MLNIKKISKKLVLGSVLGLALSFVFAQEEDFLSDYESRSWTASDGLTGNTITDVLQDQSGYLYIGTYDGLMRFDGVDFLVINHTYDPKYNFVSARTLFQDTRGNLWVGSNDEGVACIFPDQQVKMFTIDDGLPNNSIRAIREDFEGNIWIGTASGVAYIRSSDKKIIIPQGLEVYDDERILVTSLYCDTAGRVWVTGGKPDSTYYYSSNHFERYTGIHSIEHPSVTYMTQDARGAFWYGVAPHYAVKIDSGVETLYDIGHGAQKGTIVTSIHPDRAGNIWFGLDSGMAILHDGNIFFYDITNGLIDNHINHIIEDKEKNIWLATDRGGLEKLSYTKFKTINLATTINAICQDTYRGLVWLGGDDGLYCYDSSMQRVSNNLTELCKDIRIRHVGMTKDNKLLVSTYEKLGQIIYYPDDTIQTITSADGLSGMKVRVAIQDTFGNYYIGTTNGLNIVDHKTGEITVINRESGILNAYIMCIYETEDGTIWVGTDGGGVFTVKDRKVDRIFTTKNGLAGNVIFKICELNENELWICTGTGVSRYKSGQFFTFNSINGLGTDSIFQILVDYTDHAWMTSNRGISCAKFSTMEDLAEGKVSKVNTKFFSKSDGIHSGGTTSTSLSMVDNLGRMWFTLIDGFAIYDPVKVTSNSSIPSIQIEKITADNTDILYDGSEIVLQPNVQRVIIKYTGLSFVSSEQMLFKYKLDGFDKDYSEWTSSRAVSYTNLKPGKYRFLVYALNSDDIESPLSTPLVITKKPYFWELWYFWGCVAVFVGGIVGLLIISRFHHLNKYKKLLEEEVNRQTKELTQKNIDLKEAMDKSEKLLLNILPESVAKELSNAPDKVIADQHSNVSVLFADIVGFTKMSTGRAPDEIVKMLNALFTRFDTRATNEGIEKIKTIGDCYMAATGLTLTNNLSAQENAFRMINFARGLQEDIADYNKTHSVKIQMRVGINSGSVVAGVIGKTKFIYDIWGDTVNVACRMESSGMPARIHVTTATYEVTKDIVEYEEPVEIEIKGKGLMKTYFTKN